MNGSVGNDNWVTSRPAIVNWLYLASFAVGVTSIIGVILAFVWKDDADPHGWEISHFRYQIRTFLIGLVVGVAGVVLSFVLIGIPILLALIVWFIIRTVISLQRASKGEPIPDPTTLLW